MNDALPTAIAIQHGCTLCSADHYCQRFAGLGFVDPLSCKLAGLFPIDPALVLP